MDTDLDHDDAIGRRFGALHTWEPPAPADDAWRGVEARRGRRRSRRYAAAAVVVILTVVGTVAAVANYRSSDRRVLVTAPPNQKILSVLPPAPVGDIDVEPAGPYRAHQSVRAFVGPSPTFPLGDAVNAAVEVCFAYGGGEICDDAVDSQYIEAEAARGVEAYDVTLPGWVHTPAGLQPCDQVGCRLEIANGEGARIGTSPLTIEPGPKPIQPVRVDGVHRDEALLSVHVESLEPDPSWTSWSATATPAMIDDFPAGNLALCAFAEHLLCDALVRPDPPPFDGAPHDLTIETNRLLLTPRGWVDCSQYVCAIVVSRSIGVVGFGGSVGSGGETLAIVPYRLPATTTVMARPSLTIDRAGPFAVDDTVTVTLHDPPPNVDADHRLRLGQCASDDLRWGMDCVTRFSDDSAPQSQTWTRLADGSLQQRWRIAACNDARGCYLAIEPPVKGHPEVARTPGRFDVAG